MAIACSTTIGCNSSLEDTLAVIKALGFSSVDVLLIENWVHLNPSQLAAQFDASQVWLSGLLAQYELTPIAINTGVTAPLYQRSEALNGKRLRETEALARLAQHLGVSVAAYQPYGRDPNRTWEAALPDCLDTLRELVAVIKSSGVRFGLELHSGSPFETLQQVRRLVDEIPGIPIAYDPSHFVMQGIDLKDTVWMFPYACHVHLRDAARGHMQAPDGAGEVDFEWLLKSLKDSGYQGHLAIEYLENDVFDAVDSTRRLLEKVAQLWL